MLPRIYPMYKIPKGTFICCTPEPEFENSYFKSSKILKYIKIYTFLHRHYYFSNSAVKLHQNDIGKRENNVLLNNVPQFMIKSAVSKHNERKNVVMIRVNSHKSNWISAFFATSDIPSCSWMYNNPVQFNIFSRFKLKRDNC